jgi:hypothetical protein
MLSQWSSLVVAVVLRLEVASLGQVAVVVVLVAIGHRLLVKVLGVGLRLSLVCCLLVLIR